jgi:hypothetical protein
MNKNTASAAYEIMRNSRLLHSQQIGTDLVSLIVYQTEHHGGETELTYEMKMQDFLDPEVTMIEKHDKFIPAMKSYRSMVLALKDEV